MNGIFAGSPPVAQGSGLTDVLVELHKLTGVKPGEWLIPENESADDRAQRLEFLADVMLGVAEGDMEKGRHVARLHCQVLAPKRRQPLANDKVFGPDAEAAQPIVKRMVAGQLPSPDASSVPDARVLAGVGAS
ncbi:hypothetical protein ACH4PU_30570 [Streptomyces sp. NPDC021100]|uniref:hypothetical protein n=1 Tax=Streptomyces sp. NPDC021100 TaxID=3365114 RepID=UPI003796F5BD